MSNRNVYVRSSDSKRSLMIAAGRGIRAGPIGAPPTGAQRSYIPSPGRQTGVLPLILVLRVGAGFRGLGFMLG